MTVGLVEVRFVTNLDSHEVITKNLVCLLSDGKPCGSVIDEERNA